MIASLAFTYHWEDSLRLAPVQASKRYFVLRATWSNLQGEHAIKPALASIIQESSATISGSKIRFLRTTFYASLIATSASTLYAQS